MKSKRSLAKGLLQFARELTSDPLHRYADARWIPAFAAPMQERSPLLPRPRFPPTNSTRW